MKVKISRETLIKALQIIQPIVSSNPRIKLLNHILIEANKERGVVNMMALNDSMFVKCACEADIKKAGTVVLNAKVMFNILRAMKSDDVLCEVGDNYVAEFRCLGASFKLVGISGDEFQGIGGYLGKDRTSSDDEFLNSLLTGGNEKNADAPLKFTIEQLTLKEMFKNTIYAVSSDESRIPFNSVFLGIADKTLSTIATDARRLSLIEYGINVASDVNIGLLIPSRTVNEVINILGETGSVTVHCAKKSIGFDFGNILLVSKLVDASYPNYRQAIPASNDGKIKVEREQLLNAVRRASSLYVDGLSDAIMLILTKNKMTVMTEKKDVGEYNEELPIGYEGRDMKMSFDVNAFMDPLKNLTVDEITIDVTDELSPVVIKCNKPFIYVLMPINLK
jgi:DNA polymerase-3 subunit beta